MIDKCRYCKSETGLVLCGEKFVCLPCLVKHRNIIANSIDNICALYRNMSFDTFDCKLNTKVVETCKNFADMGTGRCGLLLYSKQAGNGKTHLGISTLRKWILDSYVPLYDKNGFLPLGASYEIITEPNLFLLIRKSFQVGSDENEYDITYKYTACQFLLIDDIGKYSVSDASFLQRVWYNIINERYLNNRLTVITSNKNGAELQSYLGEYTFDRICGMTHNKITEVIGTSRRRDIK